MNRERGLQTARALRTHCHPKQNRKQKRGKRENTKKGKKCRQSQRKLPSTPQGGGLLLLPLLPLPQRSSPWDACTNRRAMLRWVRPVVQHSHMLRQSAVGDAVVNWKSTQLFVHVTRPFPLDLTFARVYGGSSAKVLRPSLRAAICCFLSSGNRRRAVRENERATLYTHSSSRRGSSGRRSQERRHGWPEETKTY